MKIYSSITYDFATGEIIDLVSEDYQGKLALCGDAGMGDIAIADATGDGGEVPDVDTGGESDLGEGADHDGDIMGGEGEGADTEAGDILADGEEHAEAEQGQSRDKEVLPQQLAKALRELKTAHADSPETLKVLNELKSSFYTAKTYKDIFKSPDDARTLKAALEAVGGTDGIDQMRGEISSIESFDRMASEGNPKVIDGLAQEFPDGFKRLVAPTLHKLSTMDPAAYRETMRGPLLGMLEGDGLIDVIGSALEELKTGSADGVTRAQRELTRIATWYNQLRQQETEYQGRYKDPRVNQFAQEKQQLQQEKIEIYKTAVRSDLQTYLSGTMGTEITKLLAGKPQGSRSRFEQNVRNEVYSNLQANPSYVRGVNDLCNQGKREEAVRFAKPFIDAARRQAVPAVYKDFYGVAPGTVQVRKPVPPAQRTGATTTQQQASNKPVPIRIKPKSDDINWDKTSNVMFVTGKAYLTNGKFVAWDNNAQR